MEYNLDSIKDNLEKYLDHYGDDLHDSHLKTITASLKMLKTIEFSTDLPLFVVDLNAVMIETEFVPDMSIERDGWVRVGKSLRRALPNSTEFFNWFLKNEGKVRVAIWSSSYLSNVKKTIDGLFPHIKGKLAFVWGQEQCETMENPNHDPEDKKSKPTLFWKNVSRIMEMSPQYRSDRILIIDDSEQKLERNEKRNCLILNENSSVMEEVLNHPMSELLPL